MLLDGGAAGVVELGVAGPAHQTASPEGELRAAELPDAVRGSHVLGGVGRGAGGGRLAALHVDLLGFGRAICFFWRAKWSFLLLSLARFVSFGAQNSACFCWK